MKRFLAWGLALLAGTVGAQSWYGDGSDGPLVVDSPHNYYLNSEPLAGNVSAGSTEFRIYDGGAAVAVPGDEVMLYSWLPGGVAKWETATVVATTPIAVPFKTLNLLFGHDVEISSPLVHGHDTSTVVVKVPHYTDVAIGPSGVLSFGSLVPLVFRASGTVMIDGSIVAKGAYRGGDPGRAASSPYGFPAIASTIPKHGAGAPGATGPNPAGGGGGGHATAGEGGESTDDGVTQAEGGEGGGEYGTVDLVGGFFAGAGGGGGGIHTANGTGDPSMPRGAGGRGGACILVSAASIAISGTISVDGAPGQDGSGASATPLGGGGGGAGGAIWLVTDNLSGSGTLTALGGEGGAGGTGDVATGAGGRGGDGRIRIDTPAGNAGALTLDAGSIHFETIQASSAVEAWAVY